MQNRKYAAMALILILIMAPFAANAAEGFFAGASIGSASLNEDFDGLTVDDGSTSYRIVAGWGFNRYFALEGGYHNFGKFEQTFDNGGVPNTATLTADGFTLAAAGSLPLSEKFALTGRAGVFFWDGNAEVNNVSEATPEDTNLFLGAGASFDLTNRFMLTGDWTRYELESAVSNVYSLGFQYQFNGK
jgi:OOP family OmpA-OmpF porin